MKCWGKRHKNTLNIKWNLDQKKNIVWCYNSARHVYLGGKVRCSQTITVVLLAIISHTVRRTILLWLETWLNLCVQGSQITAHLDHHALHWNATSVCLSDWISKSGRCFWAEVMWIAEQTMACVAVERTWSQPCPGAIRLPSTENWTSYCVAEGCASSATA